MSTSGSTMSQHSSTTDTPKRKNPIVLFLVRDVGHVMEIKRTVKATGAEMVFHFTIRSATSYLAQHPEVTHVLVSDLVDSPTTFDSAPFIRALRDRRGGGTVIVGLSTSPSYRLSMVKAGCNNVATPAELRDGSTCATILGL
ncbi:hypothetical protein HJC99_04405 [Candidatus Saccharibacteria bacterium]|nr:hypothetical protein [Candidatus Saccharibacteria bacterium]